MKYFDEQGPNFDPIAMYLDLLAIEETVANRTRLTVDDCSWLDRDQFEIDEYHNMIKAEDERAALLRKQDEEWKIYLMRSDHSNDDFYGAVADF